MNTSLATFNSNSLGETLIPKTENSNPSATLKKYQQSTKDTKISTSKKIEIVARELTKFDNRDNPLKELQNLTKKLKLKDIEVILFHLHYISSLVFYRTFFCIVEK